MDLHFKEGYANNELYIPGYLPPSPIIREPKSFIDKEFLNNYSGNDPEFEKQLIELFIKEMPEYLKDLEKNVQDENFKGIKMVAHKMKSSCGIFGLKDLVERFHKLEELSVSCQIQLILKIFHDCKSQLDLILYEMKNLLATDIDIESLHSEIILK
jgi:HPt (histidine-containing phosphotransfer) domain-containing protein